MFQWPSGNLMSVFFALHAPNRFNREKIIQGPRIHEDLDQLGEQAAEHLGKMLCEYPIDLIVSSFAPRAVKTARIVAEHFTTTPSVVLDDYLRECDFGELEGHSESDLESGSSFPVGIIKSWRALSQPGFRCPRYDFRPIGGEDDQQVLARHRTVWRSLPLLHPAAKNPLLVGHGWGLNTFLRAMPTGQRLPRGTIAITRYMTI